MDESRGRLPVDPLRKGKAANADGAAGAATKEADVGKGSAATAIDKVWAHGRPVGAGFKCDYCNRTFMGGGATRFKEQLAGVTGNVAVCAKVPKDVRKCMEESRIEDKRAKAENKARKLRIENEIARSVGVDVGTDYGDIPYEEGQLQFVLKRSLHETSVATSARCGAGQQRRIDTLFQSAAKRQGRFDIDLARSRAPVQPRIDVALNPDLKDKLGRAWSKFFHANGVAGRKANCPYFRAALKLTQQLGEGVPCPTGDCIDGSYLEKNFEELEDEMKECHKDWDRYKVSLMCDSWTGLGGESIINFMIYCNEKLIFHKTIDATGQTQNATFLYDCITKVIVEDIGVDRVMQIITDNGSNYKKACMKISRDFPKIFWQPCAAHTINLLLKSIGKFTDVSKVISSAQRICKFFYNHNNLRAALKRNIGGELCRWNATRFGTVFTFLKSFWDRKDRFRQWMGSHEWTSSPYNGDPEYAYADDCLSCRQWWDNIQYVLELLAPIYSLLRYADSQKAGTVSGFIPMVIACREMLQVYLEGQQQTLKNVLALLDVRVKNMCHNTLMLAACVLNPEGHYRFNTTSNSEYLKELAIVIERIADSSESAVQALSEFQHFRASKGIFGSTTARLAALSPSVTATTWWSLYGGDTKELQKYALRIVSQCISTSDCERNWSKFSLIQTRLRNKLCYNKLHKLVFVNHNLKLRVQQLEASDHNEKEKLTDPIQDMIDCALFDHTNPVTEWLNEPESVVCQQAASLLVNKEREKVVLAHKKRKKGAIEDEEDEFDENEIESDDLGTWGDIDDGIDDGDTDGEQDEDETPSSKKRTVLNVGDDETTLAGEGNDGTSRPRRACRNKTKDIYSLLGCK